MSREGLIARTAIQCIDPRSGQVGDWIFSGDNHRDASAACSPLFGNIIKLCDWCRANGWKSVGDGYAYEGKSLPPNLANDQSVMTVRRKLGRWDS